MISWLPGLQGSLGECTFLWFFVRGSDMSPSAVTYARVGVDLAKVLVPRIFKLAIPVGLVALVYTYK